jgi:O-6-methylguanine DNA methyltransferase
MSPSELSHSLWPSLYLSASAAFGGSIVGLSEQGLVFVHPSAEAGLMLRAHSIAQCYCPGTVTLPLLKAPAHLKNRAASILSILESDKRPALNDLSLKGTPLQHAVWSYLYTIPKGELRTYSQVAHAVDAPRAVRAVANACAHNRLAVVIPCHRVIRADGTLGGYRWGLHLKRALLCAEGALNNRSDDTRKNLVADA